MKIYLFSIVVACSLFGSTVSAAVLRVENPEQVVQVGDVLSVLIIADTEGKQINAASAAIQYTSDTISFKRVVDGGSVINFWVEEPRLEGDKIMFSGITPGGFSGQDIELLTLEFEVIKEGVAAITPTNVELLLHDGLGTQEQTVPVPLALNILGQLSAPSADTIYIDTEAPEVFSPVISSDKDLFDGRMFLVFQTEDKGSGIDFYEVKEGDFGTYEKAKSPYELKDQSLSKKIYVRAVDREGNEYVAELYPQSFTSWHESPVAKTVILIVCITLVLFVLRRFFAKPSLR